MWYYRIVNLGGAYPPAVMMVVTASAQPWPIPNPRAAQAFEGPLLNACYTRSAINRTKSGSDSRPVGDEGSFAFRSN
jgi:hypothetical protein